MEDVPRHLLVLGDSLTYHGPERAEPPGDTRIWPQVVAAELQRRSGDPVVVDLFARPGWTARDGWWALTRDPHCWGEAMPRASVVVLALGQMDQLPAAVPTYLREGIPFIRPAAIRRRVRTGYRVLAPRVMSATGGPWRQLPQPATNHYLSRIVAGLRYFRPGLPIVLLGPSPYRAPDYPSLKPHPPAVAAGRSWAARNDVHFIDLDPIVGPSLAAGTGNPDGLHWSWTVHRDIGVSVAGALDRAARPAAEAGGGPDSLVGI